MSSVLYAYLDRSGRRVLCANVPACRSGNDQLAVIDEFALPGGGTLRRIRLNPLLQQVKGANVWRVPSSRLKRLADPRRGSGLAASVKGSAAELPATAFCPRCNMEQVLDAERLRVTTA